MQLVCLRGLFRAQVVRLNCKWSESVSVPVDKECAFHKSFDSFVQRCT